MNMREKMARAISAANGDTPWEELDMEIQGLFFIDADAALSAMEEPTREMWAAGGNAIVGKTKVHHDAVLTAGWNAMIGAAREG